MIDLFREELVKLHGCENRRRRLFLAAATRPPTVIARHGVTILNHPATIMAGFADQRAPRLEQICFDAGESGMDFATHIYMWMWEYKTKCLGAIGVENRMCLKMLTDRS
jgi:hypothetical protein